jgi:DNA-binding MarR family transcriptional regulator
VERFKTFTVLIANLSRSIRKIKTEEMAKWNLKSHHVSCIYYLYEREFLTPKELTEISGEDKANLSRSIEHLEENGFLKTEAAPGRKYKIHLALTEKGKAVGKEIRDRIDSILLRSSEGVSVEERKVMYNTLMRINENLQSVCDEYND